MKRPSPPLAPASFAAMLRGCGRGWIGHRDRALLWLLYGLGLRAAEAAAIDVADLELDHGRLFVRRPKGLERERSPSSPRTLGLPPAAAEALGAWYSRRLLGLRAETRAGAPADALLLSHRGRRLNVRQVHATVRKLAARACIPHRVHPHQLRHAFAQALYERTRDVSLVQRALGHRSLATTAVYLSKLPQGDVIEAMRARVGVLVGPRRLLGLEAR